ncbi:MAG: hypothetical protein ACYDCP_11185 [Thermoplasmataceae archaeon]
MLGTLSSGLFSESHGHFYFSPFTNQSPYYPGSYENYSISGSNLLLTNRNATGYLNVSSTPTITTLKIQLSFYESSKPAYVNRTAEIQDNGGKFYYNGSRIMLPFFYANSVVSSIGDIYENATPSNISRSMITQSGIYEFHPGIYINMRTEFDVFAARNKMLVGMEGVDPVISNVLGVQTHYGNKSYPVGMILTLHSTSYVVFPVNWLYVVAVYVVVAFSIGFIIIVPAAIVFGVVAYRRKKSERK